MITFDMVSKSEKRTFKIAYRRIERNRRHVIRYGW